MSTKSKLLALTENLQPPQTASAALGDLAAGAPIGDAERRRQTTFPPVLPGSAPRTGPGQMLQFRGQMLAAEDELEKLRGQLARHEGASPTRRLDPALVIPSKWANRHPASFEAPEFIRLKEDIKLAGGNVQAIAVRPVAGGEGRYEIIFGHRRHRACLELGLPVLAAIDDTCTTDSELFAAMDRENRERADLSPLEQGQMYRRALDDNLYPSMRRLAEALGISHVWVSKVLVVADLPTALIDCFRSPIEVQHSHAKTLAAALETDRKGVLRRAEKLKAAQERLPPAEVVKRLIGDAGQPPPSSDVVVDGKRVGRWSRDAKQRLLIQLDAGVVDEAKLQAFLQTFADTVKSARP